MKIYLCILLFMFASIVNLKAEPLIRILVNPCEYNNHTISTSGYLGFISPIIEPSNVRLFNSLIDFENNNLEQSLIVRLPEEVLKKREMYNYNFVHLEGLFDCRLSSHGMLQSGGFREISKLVLGAKNPNYQAQVISSGSLKSTNEKSVLNFGKHVLKVLRMDSINMENIKSIVEENTEDKFTLNRIYWIFNDFFKRKSIEKYNFCKAYYFENDSNTKLKNGVLCYSQSKCTYDKKSHSKFLNDWTGSEDFCFEFIKEENKIALDLIQFK